MKILYLNSLGSILNESGEQKVEKANAKKPKKDSNGEMPLSFYREHSLRPPKDLEDEDEEFEWNEDGMLILEPEDTTEVNLDVSIPLHLFGGCEDLTNDTTVVYTTYGQDFIVTESSDEITSYVEYLSMSWFDKWKSGVFIFFRRIFKKK